MIDIEENLVALEDRIQVALRASGRRRDAVSLLAVSKKQPISAIQQAAALGLANFGENYLQEALAKIGQLASPGCHWHFIGALQGNKTRQVAEHFDWVHSVDRERIARRLSEQRPPGVPALNICVQVNIDAEQGKAGVLPGQLPALLESIAGLPNLRLRGLMAIPEAGASRDQRARSFAQMHELFIARQQAIGSEHFDTLSMGMSADLEQAIDAGATLLRVGTAIFGPRG